MTREKEPRLSPHAIRCQPYTDGPWCFAYDPAHVGRLNELKAYEALLGVASGVDADRRLEELSHAGLVVAWELPADFVVVDVLVGRKLTSGQKAKAQWLNPQTSSLSVPSGRLRVETLNSLSFGPDEPTDEGCELEVGPGEYDVVLHRVNWALMDDDREDRPELPTDVLVLQPVRKKPRRRAARLSLAEAQGEDGAWLVAGALTASVFHGTTRAHAYDASIVHVNLRGSHAERMGLRFGHSIRLRAGGRELTVPFTGYLARRGMATYFGAEWYAEHLPDDAPTAGFTPYRASTPWLLDVERTALPTGVPVSVEVDTPWYATPDSHLGDHEVHAKGVAGRIVLVSPTCVILNVGWEQLHEAGVEDDDVLELTCGDETRRVYLKASSSQRLDERRREILTRLRPERVELEKAVTSAWSRVSQALTGKLAAEAEGADTAPWEDKLERERAEAERLKAELEATVPSPEELAPIPLLAESLTHWDDPEIQLLWLAPFVGDQHLFGASPGSRMRLTVSGKLGESDDEP